MSEISVSQKLSAKWTTDKSSIKIRWSPHEYNSWNIYNLYGYMVERTVIVKDNKLLDKPITEILTKLPVKPYTLDQWESIVNSNKYGAIAAQSLYGEKFEVETQAKGINNVVSRSQEQSNRFNFAMISADNSIEIAEALGLYFKDNKVKKSEKYLYRIYSLVPRNIMKSDTVMIYASADKLIRLPQPRNLKVEFDYMLAKLTWDTRFQTDIYNSYIVEKSVDSLKTFAPITDNIIVTVTNEEVSDNIMAKFDSLTEFSETTYYRVKGINSFGEAGPPSDTVFGKSLFANNVTPVFEEKRNINNKSIYLKWSYPDSLNYKIRKFKILKSISDNDKFKKIASVENIAREYTDSKPELTNYYKVSAIDTSGKEISSFPAMVQLIDSIPPDVPKGLKVRMKSKGRLILNWKRSKADDLFGYNVYIARKKGDEYTRINNRPIKINSLIYSLNIRSLSDFVSFKVASVDKRQNQSELSKEYRLKLPDVNPPVSPTLEYVESYADSIVLTYVPSSSTDVEKYILYKKRINNPKWKLEKVLYGNDKVSYTDTLINDKSYYLYTIIAVDKFGLESKPIRPVKAKLKASVKKSSVKNIKGRVNKENHIVLTWNDISKGVKSYQIYRAANSAQIVLYKSIPANELTFTDLNVSLKSVYVYRIRAVFKDNSQSDISEKVIVKL